ncbi:hypothetical protein [Photobacterium leiognathi]|uniref:hypothetical protein n=1 Tax=Photobacterium leiognathi TaxID=553611 RepID=UPI002980DF3A|nr:hypothetical protein [Photobacterium leiognathi]
MRISRITNQILQLTHNYRAGGGKKHRRENVKRMIRIMNDIAAHEGINDIRQLGRKHVERYWQRHEHLADSTKRDHHYAIEYVWCDLLGRVVIVR